ncbi:serine protease 27-like [Embiotoca jacksoni]|uniref:serine protease 27-like n=1 Tax=Embiotoca jacksoni TaxID=100190 RepID=UPI003703CDC7
MALQQFACGFTVMILLLCKACHSQEPDCGRVVINSRIVGGQDAAPGSWPWQAILFRNGTFRCGGSLITNQWVLTAAHCLTRDDLKNSKIFLGRYNQTGGNPNEVSRTLEDIICHPKYNTHNFNNDICLLKLSAPVNFTDYIRPICLASENSAFHNGTSSWVTGFGRTGDGNLPNILQEVNVPIVGNNKCNCSYEDIAGITENMICAGLENGGKDSCNGDGGGPLMSKDGGRWVQSGIVSFGVGCALPRRPGVYARVSQYQEWILENINGTAPGIVDFISRGNDSDTDFTCPTTRPTHRPPTTPDDSIFGSGENLIHFTHFISLSVLALLLHVLVGSGGM